MTKPAILALADGSIFRGEAIGADGHTVGEVVFNTAMTGYQEVVTDPSYRGQIVVFTFPQIGNYGTNPVDLESGAPQVEGLAVRELSPTVSNWRANQDLHQFLREHQIPTSLAEARRYVSSICASRHSCIAAFPALLHSAFVRCGVPLTPPSLRVMIRAVCRHAGSPAPTAVAG